MGAITSGKFLVNTPEWYGGLETPGTATLKDFVEYLARQLAEMMGAAEYTEIISGNGNRIYPAVKIPWTDGTIGEKIFAAIIVEWDKSTLLSSLSGTLKVGVCKNEGYSAGDGGYYVYEAPNFSTNNVHGAFRFIDNPILFIFNEWLFGEESFYTVDWTTINKNKTGEDTYLAPTTFVCTLENVVTGLKHNGIIFSQPYTSGNIAAITANENRIETASLGCPSYTGDASIAVVERLVFGRYYSNVFYVVYPNKHTPVSTLLAGTALERHLNGWVPGLLFVKNHSYWLQITRSTCPKALAVRAEGG